MQKYLEEALAWIGTKEIKGAVANDDIVKFHSYTSLKATSDEVAWCSAFVNFIVAKCGDRGTNSAAARSWLDWGKVLHEPTPGCIVVFDRKDKANPHAAHVAFFVCQGNSPDTLLVIGGNQHDCVCTAEYPKSKVLGYRDLK